jgi:A/G-specific adenine glycosylase
MNNSEIINLRDDGSIQAFRDNLLKWWLENGRSFPWRDTNDPYKIIVGEILLHRTNANQVVPVYKLFLRKFPNIQSVVLSNPEELDRLFHSVGLHWRWKLFHLMAIDIINKFKGEIPEKFEGLTSLPGISHYIASAVRCFAFGYPDVLLDTNTVRVTGRLFGLKITDSSRRSSQFRLVLQGLMDKTHPREFNWAFIDFAALVCKSRNVDHTQCPFTRYCEYYKSQQTTEIQ